uniref:DDE Tnp4 domain-containing protein n=1 Tax=Cyprinus carpio carpio TaxID=630221 RepID=A0A9J8B8D2_CYPCA
MKRKRTETLPDTDCGTVVPSSIINATEDDTMGVQAESKHDEHNYSQAIHSPDIEEPCLNAACKATVEALKNECTRLRAEVHHLKGKVDELSLNEEAFKGNNGMVQELTGLPSYEKFRFVFTFLSGFLKGSPRLSHFHSLVLTLMRMRLNLPLYFCLFFHMSKTSVFRIFNSTLDVMYVRLSPLIYWPSKQQIQVSVPMCFRDNFSCTSIIDFFEIFIEKPKSLSACAQTYSQYKHHNTVKYLISMTPQGVISFVSKGWGGQTSDKHITENCGYLEKLSPGDVILADRGFSVKDTVGLYCAQFKNTSIHQRQAVTAST